MISSLRYFLWKEEITRQVHYATHFERKSDLSFPALIRETSECKLQRARNVPSGIALFAPIALSNFVIGVDETSYFHGELGRQVALTHKLLEQRSARGSLLWISWLPGTQKFNWPPEIHTFIDLSRIIYVAAISNAPLPVSSIFLPVDH